MGKKIRFVILVAVANAAICSLASADIIVQQPPDPFGGPGADTLFRNQFNQVVWQQVADNVQIGTSATVRRVSWQGFYGGSDTPVTQPPPMETMRIRFYGARIGDGLPDDGNVLLEEYHADTVRTATGGTVHVGGNPLEYRYQVDLNVPLLLAADARYWLEIVQIGDIESAFRWEDGFGIINGQAYINSSGPYWRTDVGSRAFELSTVPEPSMALLFLGVISLLTGHRYRSERRCAE